MKLKSGNKDLDDEELLQLLNRAKFNDSRAVGKLCVHFYSKIYRFVYYRVNAVEDAEDITSEVCLRVIKSIHEQKGSFYAWIFRIASNMITDHYRRRVVRSNVESAGDSIEEMVDADSNQSELIEQLELRQALKRLTEDQQEVIVLKFIEGYDTDEIAHLVGKSTGAVRAIQFRALTALRNMSDMEKFIEEDRKI